MAAVARNMLAAARRRALLPFTATHTLRHALSTVSAGPAAAPLLPPPTPDGRLTVCLDMDECLLHAEVTDADLEVKGCADQSHQAQARADERTLGLSPSPILSLSPTVTLTLTLTLTCVRQPSATRQRG